MRPQHERQRGSLRVPDAIVVGCLYAEGVVPGRNVGVVRDTARAGFRPVMIEALQLETVTNLLRRHKAQPCVVELKMVMSGGNRDGFPGSPQRLLAVVH